MKPLGWSPLSKVHPTYRCGICRSLLVMGEPHSHRRTNPVVSQALRPLTESERRATLGAALMRRYARGTGYMG